MEKLYELKEMLCRELEKYAGRELTASTLEYVDKLAHAAKNLGKLIEEAEESEYSGRRGMSRDRMSRRSYGDDRSYEGGRSYGRSYEGGGSFAQRRDGRGRYSSEYSSHGDMVEELHELMEEAPEHTRAEFRKFIQKIESM